MYRTGRSLRGILFAVILALLAPAGAVGSVQTERAEGLFRDADAVTVLAEKYYRVEEDGSYELRCRLVTEILTYRGKKEHADLKIAYNNAWQSVEILKAVTHRPDGEKVSAMAEEIHDIQSPGTARSSIYSRARQRVVNFPAVTPGCTIEVEFTVHSSIGFWAIESLAASDPVLKKKVEVDLPAGMPLVFSGAEGVSHTTVGHGKHRTIYCWEVLDVPGRVPEGMEPPAENRPMCITMSTYRSWDDAAAFFRSILLKGTGTPERPVVPGWLERLADPGDIYISFMERMRPYSIGFFSTDLVPQSPAETLEKGYGTTVDLALCFSAILAEKGLSSRLLLLNRRGIFIGDLSPCPGFLDTAVVSCRGACYAFYSRDLPPGFSGFEGRYALDISGGRLEKVIGTRRSRRKSILSMKIDGRGMAAGRFTVLSDGSAAAGRRKQLRFLSPMELRIRRDRFLNAVDPFARAAGPFLVAGVDDLRACVELSCGFTVSRPVAGEEDYSVLNILPTGLPGNYKDILRGRRNRLMISHDFSDILEEKITFPDNFDVVFLPPSGAGDLKCLSWNIETEFGRSHITIRRVIRLKRGILEPGRECSLFRQAVSGLFSPGSGRVIFRRSM
ncbi:MAG TPA: DUF3857 domain-containing protein [Thermodesulfobacteriaceae bacterium]|nr:DUF3857 domain-containing protein [Thermodesulfobacteriaceae bacterium]